MLSALHFVWNVVMVGWSWVWALVWRACGGSWLLLVGEIIVFMVSYVFLISPALYAAKVRRIMRDNREKWKKLNMDLVWVIGCSGAGKSTLASRIAYAAGSTFVDLDDLYWLPGWKRRTKEQVISMLEQVISAGPVVVAGVYESDLGQLRRDKATTLVWVRPSRWRLMYQLVTRSLMNVIMSRCNCGPGNPESFYSNFLAPNCIVRKTWRRYPRIEKRFASVIESPPENLKNGIIVLTSRAETRAFLQVLDETHDAPPNPEAKSALAAITQKLAGRMINKLKEYQAKKRAARRANSKRVAQRRMMEARMLRDRARKRIADLMAKHKAELEAAQKEEEEAALAAAAAENDAVTAVQSVDAEEKAERDEAERKAKLEADLEVKRAQALTRSKRRQFATT